MNVFVKKNDLACVATSILLLAGCAGTPVSSEQSDLDYAKHFALHGDYKSAFWKLRSPVLVPAYRDEALSSIKSNPQIIEAGKDRVSPAYYAKMVEDVGAQKARNDVLSSLQALKIIMQASDYAPIEATALAYLQTDKVLQISQSSWLKLNIDEQQRLMKKTFVSIADDSKYGRVVERQVHDASTKGYNAGSQLGSAIASAHYIDKSFSGSNTYSAKSNLGASLVGAMLGSPLNQEQSQKYVFRYTIKRLDGKIEYAEKIEETPLGQSPGVCVNLQANQVDQDICDLDDETIRTTFLR